MPEQGAFFRVAPWQSENSVFFVFPEDFFVRRLLGELDLPFLHFEVEGRCCLCFGGRSAVGVWLRRAAVPVLRSGVAIVPCRRFGGEKYRVGLYIHAEWKWTGFPSRRG